MSVIKYLQEFYRKEFKLFYFLCILFLLGTWIYLNYWHSLENRFAAGSQSCLGSFWGYYFLYFIPFAGAFLLQLLFYKDCSYYKSRWFWIILFLSPAFFSFRVNFTYHQSFIKEHWAGDARVFWLHILNWVVRAVLLMILIFIFWLMKDKNKQAFYGTAAVKNLKPYLIMLLIMIPLIALASTQKDFLHMYPKAKIVGRLDLSHKNWYSLFYEICYGFDFISIEFFFRGFLILALAGICGRHCIIPAACFYCSIHFGKPMGEAISSFFGGLVLGIISYNTKSIWGGLVVHLGTAWLMEAGSWLGSVLKG